MRRLSPLLLLATLGCNGDDVVDDTGPSADDSGDVVTNQPPSAPSVSIGPDEPIHNKALTCIVTDGVDPEGEAVTTTLSWTVDGLDAGIDSDTVPAEQVLAWQTWACTAVTSDGELDSEPATAEVRPTDECVGMGGNQMQLVAPGDQSGTVFSLGTSGAEITLEAWFKLEQTTTGQTLFYKGDAGGATSNTLDYMVAAAANGDLHVAVGWSGSTDACAYQVFEEAYSWGEWFHLAFTYAADNTRRVFINGELLDECVITAKNPAQYGPLTIGGHMQISGQNYYASAQFKGIVDEIRVSSVNRYDASFEPSPWFEPDDDTLVLYHFSEAAGSVAIDAAGNYDALLWTNDWTADESACDGYESLAD